jgi:hypothetical protein
MTEHLIRQAIRELHIDIEPHNKAPEITVDADRITISGQNRKGNSYMVTISEGTPYPQILEAIRTAWRG